MIVCPIAILIAAVVFAFSFSYTYDYLTAPYHAEVNATLVKITEGETEKWEYVEGRDEARSPNKRATRTYTESVYGYHWEYTVNGITHEYVATSSSGVENKVGDVKKMYFWSYDGEEYHRSYRSGVNYVLMIASAAVIIAALFIIFRIMIIKIQMKSENKKKEQRRELNQSHPNSSLINLGNYDGKRVRITDSTGEVFEGKCDYCGKDYCEHEYGRREPCLQIANFLFFRSDVRDISVVKGEYSAPFGKIEELNFEDGIDSVEEELFCEEDEQVYRMLLCLEEYVARQNKELAGLDALLESLLKTDLTKRTRKKAEELLQHLK